MFLFQSVSCTPCKEYEFADTDDELPSVDSEMKERPHTAGSHGVEMMEDDEDEDDEELICEVDTDNDEKSDSDVRDSENDNVKIEGEDDDDDDEVAFKKPEFKAKSELKKPKSKNELESDHLNKIKAQTKDVTVSPSIKHNKKLHKKTDKSGGNTSTEKAVEVDSDGKSDSDESDSELIESDNLDSGDGQSSDSDGDLEPNASDEKQTDDTNSKLREKLMALSKEDYSAPVVNEKLDKRYVDSDDDMGDLEKAVKGKFKKKAEEESDISDDEGINIS